MVTNSGGAFLHDVLCFEGKLHRLISDSYLIHWNEEMRSTGLYGHMSFFNLKSLVYPLDTGFGDTPTGRTIRLTNYMQAEVRRQGGAVTSVHSTLEPTLEAANARELPVDLALGQMDAMDVLANTDEIASMQLWYRLLNYDFRLAISPVGDHLHRGWEGDRQGGHGDRPFALQHAGEDNRADAGRQSRHRGQCPCGGIPRRRREARDRRTDPHHSQFLDWRAGTGLVASTDLERHTGVRAYQSGLRYLFRTADARGDGRFCIDWVEWPIARVEQRGRFATLERRQEVVDLCRLALEVYRGIEPEGATD